VYEARAERLKRALGFYSASSRIEQWKRSSLRDPKGARIELVAREPGEPPYVKVVSRYGYGDLDWAATWVWAWDRPRGIIAINTVEDGERDERNTFILEYEDPAEMVMCSARDLHRMLRADRES